MKFFHKIRVPKKGSGNAMPTVSAIYMGPEHQRYRVEFWGSSVNTSVSLTSAQVDVLIKDLRAAQAWVEKAHAKWQKGGA